MKIKCSKLEWFSACLEAEVTASNTRHTSATMFSTAAGMDASHVQLKPMFSSAELLLLGIWLKVPGWPRQPIKILSNIKKWHANVVLHIKEYMWIHICLIHIIILILNGQVSWDTRIFYPHCTILHSSLTCAMWSLFRQYFCGIPFKAIQYYSQLCLSQIHWDWRKSTDLEKILIYVG